MLRRQLQTAAAPRWGAIPLALVLLFGGLGARLVSTSRFAENEENSPTKNLSKELLISHRINPKWQLRLDVWAKMSAVTILQPLTLGHTQKCTLGSPSGRRLPNGHLAPLTC